MQLTCPKCRMTIESDNEGLHSEISCKSCGCTLEIAISLVDSGPTPVEKTADFPETEIPGFDLQEKGSSSHPDVSDSTLKILPVGEKFGDYLIESEIARGGMGVVFKARQVSLSRAVALKMIRSSYLASSEEVRRFRQEAEAVAKIDHPGIIPIHEVGQIDGQYYFSMGLVEGGSLSDLPKHGSVEPEKAAKLVKIIAESMHFAHTRNIIHRDLKPSNILIDSKGNPKITDFGLAKDLETDAGLTSTGAVLGTPSYMAPEQAAGRLDEVGMMTDVYALGGILYFLLTGRPPFKEKTSIETIQQVLKGQLTSPETYNPKVDHNLSTICMKCLNKEIHRRYGSAKELADDLDRWLERKPILARPVSLWERSLLWSLRNKATLFVLIAILLISSLSAILIEHNSRENQRRRMTTVVNSLTSLDGDIHPSLNELDEFPPTEVLNALNARYASESLANRLPLAYGLAHLGSVDSEFLLSQVENMPPEEFGNLTTALGHDEHMAITNIRSALSSADREQNWKLKSRLAMVAFYLGDSNPVMDMCKSRSDPVQRSSFISECVQWHGDLTKLLRLLKQKDRVEIRSAMILVVGQIDGKSIHPSSIQAWQPQLISWYLGSPESTIHSAAGWTLQNWGLKLPKIKPNLQPDAGMHWYVNTIGMTLALIEKGNYVRSDIQSGPRPHAQTVEISRSFLMSNAEVSVIQFRQFNADPNCPVVDKPRSWRGIDTRISASESHPAHNIDWYDAILFCNWLSRKEGLTPCYQRTGEVELVHNLEFRKAMNDSSEPVEEVIMEEPILEEADTGRIVSPIEEQYYDVWRILKDADGYRLPTEAEWEYACRAGTTTEYSFGDKSYWENFAVCDTDKMSPVRSKLPNPWGMFDLHGNAYEWCHDWYGPYGTDHKVIDPFGSESGDRRVIRGGDFSKNPNFASSSFRSSLSPAYVASGLHGFRIVRYLPAPD